MKMLPMRSRNCREPTGSDLVWVSFLFFSCLFFVFFVEVKLGYECQ